MPNKKQSKWWSLATAVVLSALTACTNDTETQANNNNTADNGALAALTQATGISGTNTISIPRNPGTAQRNADGSYNMTDFIIDMDLIKKTVVDEKTAYSFSIMPKVVTSMSDFNLIVYNNGDGWKYSIMELIRKPGTEGKFKGTVKELYSSAARGSGCFTIFVEYRHCTNTGECASGTCDRCSLCVDYDSLTFCRTETEEYLSAELAEEPNYGGGGSAHTEPQDIVVPSDGFVFETNIKENVLAQTRKERAKAFYNILTPEQQQWAGEHPDSYNSLVNYLLDHFSPDNELKIMELVALAAADGGEITIDNSVTPENAMVFNTIEDFEQFLDDINITQVEEEFDPVQRRSVCKASINFMIDLNIVATSTNPPFHLDSITSDISGFTDLYVWNQTQYLVSNLSDNSVRVHLYGDFFVKLSVCGIKATYKRKIHIEFIVKKDTGKITGFFAHEN